MPCYAVRGLCFLWMAFEHLSLQFTCRLFIYSIHNDSLRNVNWTITTFTRDHGRLERKSFEQSYCFYLTEIVSGFAGGSVSLMEHDSMMVVM